jgi:hypothetical protein
MSTDAASIRLARHDEQPGVVGQVMNLIEGDQLETGGRENRLDLGSRVRPDVRHAVLSEVATVALQQIEYGEPSWAQLVAEVTERLLERREQMLERERGDDGVNRLVDVQGLDVSVQEGNVLLGKTLA